MSASSARSFGCAVPAGGGSTPKSVRPGQASKGARNDNMNKSDLPGAPGLPGSDGSSSFATDSHSASHTDSSGGGAEGSSSGGGEQRSGFGAGLDTAAHQRKKKARRRSGTAAKEQAKETKQAKGGEKASDGQARGSGRRASSGGGRGRGRSSAEKKSAETSGEAGGSEGQAKGGGRSGSRGRRSAGRGKGEGAGRGTTKAQAADAADSSEAQPRTRRRRSGSRRGTGGQREAAAADAGEAQDKQGAAETKSSRSTTDKRGGEERQVADGVRRKRGSRGSRGGRGRSGKGARAGLADAIPGEVDDLPDLPDLPHDAELVEEAAADQGGRSGRRKQSTRKKAAKKTTKKAAKRTTRKTTKKTTTKATTKATERTAKKSGRKVVTRKAAQPEKEIPRDATILVNVANDEEQRVAVARDGRITDFMMSVESQKSLVNDVYRGKVVNLEPAIGAAFVDFGQGRNGFLHTSDVLSIYGEKGFTLGKLLTAAVDPEEWDESSSQPSLGEELEEAEDSKKKKGGRDGRSGAGKRGGRQAPRRSRPRNPIESLLKVGQSVAVQVTKESIGDKGPTLTTYISIPGRFLVLMPSMARVGISRKIEDEKERKRLKKILDSLNVPEGMGIIVRTAGTKKTKEEIKRDLDYLLGVWTNFSKRLPLGRGPMPLYQESDMAICTMRDLFDLSTEKVVVDDEKTYEQVLDFTRRLMPEHEDRIHLHDGDRPIFHHHGLEQEFEKIFSRRIELPSGGSIVFDQAEALVAIDVNSGRTRSSKNDFEETALMTNLEAVPEIARQIRLRDLGGILVIDFIDMMRPASNRAVERAFRDELVSDRARSRVGRISQFGLLELTRQRLGPGMNKKLFTNCPRCRGQGRVRTVESRSAALLRRLGSALTLKGFSSVEVRAHPDTIEYVKRRRMDRVRELEKQHEREIRFTAVPDQLDDSVLCYMRSDGREVRPGGRRKR